MRNIDNIFEMGATKRHGQTIGAFFSEVWEKVKAKELFVIPDSCSLVYSGEKIEPDMINLIDAGSVGNTEHFREHIINNLKYVQPDFMLFKNNKYIENDKETRIAGCPDLVIEVWSEDNGEKDRAFKKYLYSTSSITEHWYIEQDSNIIECYYGREKIGVQNLADILVSRDGIKFDLRYLKLPE
ncbi:MAG: Uma2 family endonuclease [Oscillospiraceae bacterium]|nr:Uma2 family endonuclease [Oscillospiraceae bacterium]